MVWYQWYPYTLQVQEMKKVMLHLWVYLNVPCTCAWYQNWRKSYQQARNSFSSLDLCECSVFSGNWRQPWVCGTAAGWEMPNHDMPPQEAVGHNFLGISPSPQADVSFFTCTIEQTTSTWLHLCFATCCFLVHSSDIPLASASAIAGRPHYNSLSFSTGTSTTAWWQKLHLGTCDVLSSAAVTILESPIALLTFVATPAFPPAIAILAYCLARVPGFRQAACMPQLCRNCPSFQYTASSFHLLQQFSYFFPSVSAPSKSNSVIYKILLDISIYLFFKSRIFYWHHLFQLS